MPNPPSSCLPAVAVLLYNRYVKTSYIPSCRRITDQLKGKHVMQLNWGGSISFAGKTEYILLHGPDIMHGANENLTFLYHILRADLWDPRTTAADHLDLEIDGASDNVATAAQMFYCHLYKVKWKCSGLNQMLLGYRNSGQRVMILLMQENFDWETYFNPCVNSNVKYAGKPLHWKYEASPVEGAGAVYLREPIISHPPKLEPVKWVTEKQHADLHEIFRSGMMSEEEVSWMKEIMLTGKITRIHKDGEYGEGNLPGYPAHVACRVKKGKLCRADIRVLEDLPANLWAAPPNRIALQEERTILTPEEEAELAKHRIFSRKPTPSHPANYPGARTLTEEERKAWRGEVVDTVPEVRAALEEKDQTEEKFGKLRKITVKKLKEFCARHGLPQSGLRPVLVNRVWRWWVLEREEQKEPSEPLDLEAEVLPEGYDELDAYEAAGSMAGNEDIEASGSDND
eukprot:g76701.t1